MSAQNPAPKREHRRHPRVRVKVYADLQWQGPDGYTRFTRAECVDVSESGLCLRASTETPERGAQVQVRLDHWLTAERGIVRHARLRGLVGIELRLEAVSPADLKRWREYVAALHAETPGGGPAPAGSQS